MYLENQTQFGDIPRPREGSAGMFLDSAQPVADGVGVADKYFSRTAHRPIIVLPHPKRFEQHLPVLVGKIAKTVQRNGDRLIITSGALTAAVARIEPSNTATDDVESVGPRNITLATCRARGVSRRSSKAALTPTRTVVIRDMRATTMSSFRLDATCTIPTCKSGSRRHAENMSRLRSFDSISGERIITDGGTLGGDDDKRTIDRQPKVAGDLPQTPFVESSSLKQRVNPIRTS